MKFEIKRTSFKDGYTETVDARVVTNKAILQGVYEMPDTKTEWESIVQDIASNVKMGKFPVYDDMTVISVK